MPAKLCKIKFHGTHSCDLVRDTSPKTLNKPSQIWDKFEFTMKQDIYLSVVHFFVEQDELLD